MDVQPTSKKGVHYSVDELTGILSVIEIEHHEIHEGNHYFVCDRDTDVDKASPKYWLLRAPNTSTRIHLVWTVSVGAAGIIEFYENPTWGTGNSDGTGLIEFNNDRNSSNTATLATFKDAVLGSSGTDGTLLCIEDIPADKKSGNMSVRSKEIILKKNEDYLFKFTPDADNTGLSVIFEWYELL